jgi:hypothetical protein
LYQPWLLGNPANTQLKEPLKDLAKSLDTAFVESSTRVFPMERHPRRVELAEPRHGSLVERFLQQLIDAVHWFTNCSRGRAR